MNPRPLNSLKIQNLNGVKTLKINLGISQNQIDQLIKYTTSDPIIQKFTSDSDRFSDQISFENWRKNRLLFTLTDEQDILYGFIWIREKNIPIQVQADRFNPESYGVTVAVRLYPSARGRGLLVPFLKSVFEYYLTCEDYQKAQAKGIWLLTSQENIAAQKSFEKFGFKRVENKIPSDKILMIL